MTPALHGVCRINVWRGDRLVEAEVGENLVTAAGRDAWARLAVGSLATLVADVGFGDGTAAPLATDTALAAARIWRPVGTVDAPSAGVLRVAWSLPVGLIVDGALSEIGLRASDGTLVARRVRATPIPMAPDVQLTGEWTIQLVEV
jgi:hypothetical protein